MERSVLSDIEARARNGDAFLQECEREMHRHLCAVTQPEAYESIAQAFAVYAEANTYPLLHKEGVQLSRTPGTGGHGQMRPDFLHRHSSGEIYFEVKCLDFEGGKDRHKQIAYDALDVAADLDARARKLGVHFTEMVISSFDVRATPADRIETLISKLENNAKMGQLRYGPCILVVDLGRLGLNAHNPGCILPVYYYEGSGGNSCIISGELWHVALGRSGDMIYKLPEFQGDSNLDRPLKKKGILHQYPELFGISFVLHGLSGEQEIYSVWNITPEKDKLGKPCTLSEDEVGKLICSYSDAFNDSENRHEYKCVHQTLDGRGKPYERT